MAFFWFGGTLDTRQCFIQVQWNFCNKYCKKSSKKRTTLTLTRKIRISHARRILILNGLIKTAWKRPFAPLSYLERLRDYFSDCSGGKAFIVFLCVITKLSSESADWLTFLRKFVNTLINGSVLEWETQFLIQGETELEAVAIWAGIIKNKR